MNSVSHGNNQLIALQTSFSNCTFPCKSIKIGHVFRPGLCAIQFPPYLTQPSRRSTTKSCNVRGEQPWRNWYTCPTHAELHTPLWTPQSSTFYKKHWAISAQSSWARHYSREVKSWKPSFNLLHVYWRLRVLDLESETWNQ